MYVWIICMLLRSYNHTLVSFIINCAIKITDIYIASCDNFFNKAHSNFFLRPSYIVLLDKEFEDTKGADRNR